MRLANDGWVTLNVANNLAVMVKAESKGSFVPMPNTLPPPVTDWLDVLAKIVRCFSHNEGTWFQSDWRTFGVTPEQERIIEAAVKKQEARK